MADKIGVEAKVVVTGDSKGIKRNDYKEQAKHSKELAGNIEKTTNSAEKLRDTVKDIFNKSAIIGWAKIIKDTVNGMVKASEKQAEYIENLNMMRVAFDKNADSAVNYIRTVSNATGFDASNLTRQLGIFRQISSAMGYTNEIADMLSKNLSKLSLDISSLYNVNVERAGKALESAITGQVRSIRSLTGADITLATLQQEAYARGINKTTAEMTRAEKTILIYLTLERQLANANGDMARTINSVANQTKIFKDQIIALGRNIGGLLIPVLKTLLPILNGILMVVNTIVEMILALFDIDANTLSQEFGLALGGFEDLESDLLGVESASNKAKKSLRGFDKLNNITTPSAGGSSGGAGGGLGFGGVDSRLLEALKDYNLHLDEMKNKATKIRDKILEVLNFHKELNEETGQWEWKYGGILGTIKNLYNWFVKLSPKAKLVVGTITTLATAKVVKGISNLFGVLVNSVKPIQKLAEAFKLMDNLSFSNLSAGINAWKDSLTIGEKLQSVIIGTGGIVAGIALTKDGIKKITEESKTALGIVETGLGGISSVLGGAMAGASVGGATGGLIGGVLAGIGYIITAIDEADTSINTNIHDIEKAKEEVDQLYNKWQEGIKAVQDTYNTANIEKDYYQRLFEELQGIVDENGKIKEGYEERAQVITNILAEALGIEIEVVDGSIQKWQELNGEIDNYIIKRTNAMKLTALEQSAQEALNNLAEAQESVVLRYNELDEAQKNFMERAEKKSQKWYGITAQQLYEYAMGMKTAKELAEELGTTEDKVNEQLKNVEIEWRKQISAVKDAEQNYENAQKTLDGYRQTIKNYETALGLSLSNNQEALDKFFDHEQYLYGKSYDEQEEYWEKRKKLDELSLSDLEKNKNKYSQKEYEDLKKSYTDDYNLVESEMEKLKLLINTKNGEITDEMVNQWAKMGETSEQEFINKISELPDDVKNELYDKLKEKGVELTKGMQEVFNTNKPKIDVDVDAKPSSNLASSLSNIVSNIKSSLGNILNIKFKADGGFVNSGDIFVANENNRPEFVGTFGHQTAVANTDQIVDGIAIGVTKAMMATGGQDKKVVIEAKGDTSGLLDFITFEQKKKDRQYGL